MSDEETDGEREVEETSGEPARTEDEERSEEQPLHNNPAVIGAKRTLIR